MFRRKEPAAVVRRLAVAPSVVLACEQCGFDYTVTRLDARPGETIIIWTCSCGSRILVAQETPLALLVRR